MSTPLSTKTKIIYWIPTIIIGLFSVPGIFMLNSPDAINGMLHLGLPNWFRLEVTIGQSLGGFILLTPIFNPLFKTLKSWVYVAFGIKYLSAFIAHVAVDGFSGMAVFPLVFFAILCWSYYTFSQHFSTK